MFSWPQLLATASHVAVPAIRSGLAAVASRTRFEAGAWFLALQNCSNPLVPNVGTEFSQLPDDLNQLNPQHSNLAPQTDRTVARTQRERWGTIALRWGGTDKAEDLRACKFREQKWPESQEETGFRGKGAKSVSKVIVNDE
jgi:hypothetical protein